MRLFSISLIFNQCSQHHFRQKAYNINHISPLFYSWHMWLSVCRLWQIFGHFNLVVGPKFTRMSTVTLTYFFGYIFLTNKSIITGCHKKICRKECAWGMFLLGRFLFLISPTKLVKMFITNMSLFGGIGYSNPDFLCFYRWNGSKMIYKRFQKIL